MIAALKITVNGANGPRERVFPHPPPVRVGHVAKRQREDAVGNCRKPTFRGYRVFKNGINLRFPAAQGENRS
jgi:hypothetical protein